MGVINAQLKLFNLQQKTQKLLEQVKLSNNSIAGANGILKYLGDFSIQ
jgi:hypothetical protein